LKWLKLTLLPREKFSFGKDMSLKKNQKKPPNKKPKHKQRIKKVEYTNWEIYSKKLWEQ